jgi:hypothetical protein
MNPGTLRTYRFTFGSYSDEIWTDVRPLTWTELTAVLTHHEIGAKKGTCIVPAVFSGTRRRKAEAAQIEVAFLDCDIGTTLDEIRTATAAHGWAAIISSTHSHLTTRTAVKRTEWERFVERQGGQASLEMFLREIKGYLTHVAAGAKLGGEVGAYVLIEHAPCPKFRVAVPLLRAWSAADYTNQNAANAAWRSGIEALAAALQLHHDQSCTDTSRLFYLPRRPADGPDPETAVLEGAHCDIFTLPQPPGSGGSSRRARGGGRHGRVDDDAGFVDPDTGEVFDLRAWARRCGSRYLIETALRARRPGSFVGRVADGMRHHIHCPNEAEHSQAGQDAAPMPRAS